jgi:hypothetical protein
MTHLRVYSGPVARNHRISIQELARSVKEGYGYE